MKQNYEIKSVLACLFATIAAAYRLISPAFCMTTRIQASVRQCAQQDIFRPAQEVVQDAVQQHCIVQQPFDALPKLPSLVSTTQTTSLIHIIPTNVQS